MSFTRTTPGYPPPQLPRWAAAVLVLLALEQTAHLILDLVH